MKTNSMNPLCGNPKTLLGYILLVSDALAWPCRLLTRHSWGDKAILPVIPLIVWSVLYIFLITSFKWLFPAPAISILEIFSTVVAIAWGWQYVSTRELFRGEVLRFSGYPGFPVGFRLGGLFPELVADILPVIPGLYAWAFFEMKGIFVVSLLIAMGGVISTWLRSSLERFAEIERRDAVLLAQCLAHRPSASLHHVDEDEIPDLTEILKHANTKI